MKFFASSDAGRFMAPDTMASLPVRLLTPRPCRLLRRSRNSRWRLTLPSISSPTPLCQLEIWERSDIRARISLKAGCGRAKPSNVRSVHCIRVLGPLHCRLSLSYQNVQRNNDALVGDRLTKGAGDIPEKAVGGPSGHGPRTKCGGARPGARANLTRRGKFASFGGMSPSPSRTIPMDLFTGVSSEFGIRFGFSAQGVGPLPQTREPVPSVPPARRWAPLRYWGLQVDPHRCRRTLNSKEIFLRRVI